MKANHSIQNNTCRNLKEHISYNAEIPARFLCIIVIFYIFPEIFSNNKESNKKKRTKERKKQMLLGYCEKKNDLEIYLTLKFTMRYDKTLSQSRHLPATRRNFELLIHFEKCSTQEKLFHDLGYVLLWNSGSEYTTPANTLREYVETSATSFTQYKNRCKNCEIEEKN